MPDLTPTPVSAYDVLSQDLRKRKIALRVRQARENADKRPKDLAAFLGVQPSLLKQLESGDKEFSLSQLLAVAFWLGVSVQVFLDEPAAEATPAAQPNTAENFISLHTHIIGAKLKQARLDKNETLKEMAALLGLTAKKLEAYEMGDDAVPITTLEQCAAYYRLPIQHFITDDSSPITQSQRERHQQTQFAALPDPLKQFVLSPDAQATLHMAMQLRNLQNEGLRDVGELLVRLGDV